MRFKKGKEEIKITIKTDAYDYQYVVGVVNYENGKAVKQWYRLASKSLKVDILKRVLIKEYRKKGYILCEN